MSMTMKAKTPNDVAAFACVALGFIPKESIVMAGASGCAMTARIDMPVDEANIVEMTDALLMPSMRNGVSSVVFVIFAEDREMAEKCWSSLQSNFMGQGIGVLASVLVRDGHWEAIDQPFGVRGPLDIENHPFMLQANLEHGRVVRPDRDSLKYELAERNTLDSIPAWSPDAEAEIRRVHESFEACNDENRVFTDEELGAYLTNIQGDRRDSINGFFAKAQIEGKGTGALVSALADATARAPEEFRAMAAAVYAFGSYLHGDGARTWVGLDLARALEPNNTLASVLAEVVERAMPPEAFASMWMSIITESD